MPAKPRTKPPPQTTRDYLATLEHAIRQLSYGHHTFTIFRHFVEGLDHGIGHLASMSSHQRLKRVSDLVILRHDDYKARDGQRRSL